MLEQLCRHTYLGVHSGARSLLLAPSQIHGALHARNLENGVQQLAQELKDQVTNVILQAVEHFRHKRLAQDSFPPIC